MSYEQIAKAHREAVKLLAWSLGITPYEAAALLAGVEVRDTTPIICESPINVMLAMQAMPGVMVVAQC